MECHIEWDDWYPPCFHLVTDKKFSSYFGLAFGLVCSSVLSNWSSISLPKRLCWTSWHYQTIWYDIWTPHLLYQFSSHTLNTQACSILDADWVSQRSSWLISTLSVSLMMSLLSYIIKGVPGWWGVLHHGGLSRKWSLSHSGSSGFFTDYFTEGSVFFDWGRLFLAQENEPMLGWCLESFNEKCI